MIKVNKAGTAPAGMQEVLVYLEDLKKALINAVYTL